VNSNADWVALKRQGDSQGVMRAQLHCIAICGLCLSLVLSAGLATTAAVPDDYNFSQRMYRFSDIIQGVLESAQAAIVTIAKSVLSATMTIMGAVYAPMVVLGVLLYTTKFNRYRGRDLIFGALLLSFFSEFIMPSLLA
jgi:hypothetical protein